MNINQKNFNLGKANILKNLNIRSKDVIKSVSDKNLLHYVFSLLVEKRGIAEIFFVTKDGYELQAPNGVMLNISSINSIITINYKSYSDSFNKVFGIHEYSDFDDCLKECAYVISSMNSSTHKELMAKRIDVMSKKFENDILNDSVNPKEIIYQEAINAYGLAVERLILSDQLFTLNYFKRTKKFSTDILPKRLFCTKFMIDDTKQVGTTITDEFKIALNQIKHFSHCQPYKSTSWAKYDAKSCVQTCISDFVCSEFNINLGPRNNFMNRDGDIISQVEGFPSKDKIKAFMSTEGSEQICFYPDDLNSFIFALSKIKKTNDYYLAADGGSISVLIKFGSRFFILNADAAYYAFRDFKNYSKRNTDVMSLSLMKERIVMQNTTNMKVALQAHEVFPFEIKDIDEMHSYNVLFEPIDFLSMVSRQKELRITPKSELINKIESFQDKAIE